MKRNGTTLIETVVAVTIILLIAAIVFPVLANARRSGYRAESMSNLRQIGQAIEIYRSGADGAMPFGQLDTLVESGLISNKGILFSGTDSFKEGYGYAVSHCWDDKYFMRTNTSYETVLASAWEYKRVKSVDPDAAIVVDRTHGKIFDENRTECRRTLYYYSGMILRMFEDTHVKLGSFSVLPNDDETDVRLTFRPWRLYSTMPDAPFLVLPSQ